MTFLTWPKALKPTDSTLSGTTTEGRPVQSWKAIYPMFLRVEGSGAKASDIQPIKAILSILVTLSGMTTEVRLRQLVKA